MRSSAWICDFSSTHKTSARSGGAMYSPTTSRTFATKSGSVESLKVSTRCGCRPNARQIRCTVALDRPLALAMPRELQCVPSAGRLSNVRVITSSIRSSPILRGAPARGSSRNPSSRCRAKRCRHLRTVSGCTSSRSPTRRGLPVSAQASTIRARSASPCAVRRRAASAPNSTRSASLSASAFSRGLPIPLSPIRSGGVYDELPSLDTSAFSC